MRKNAILHRKDGLSLKIEEILGELQHGPSQFLPDTPENPVLHRTRALSKPRDSRRSEMEKTGTALISGTQRIDTLGSSNRHAVTPILKTRRSLEVSREQYTTSRNVDATLDNIYDYTVDSHRIGPRLLKVQKLEAQLSETRQKYDEARTKVKFQRQQFDELEAAALVDLEDKLKVEMLDLGSHVPTELPLEYSKFSGKVLDMHERERRSAQIRRYDDAAALRKEALAKEREELDRNNESFVRAFNLTKSHMLKKQDDKREAFHILWKRKKEKNEAAIQREIVQLRNAVQHLEDDLAEAKGISSTEMGRIQNRERCSYTPIAARPKATFT